MTVSTSEDASTPLTLLLFGPMQVLVHDHPLPPLRPRKMLWLLALLALRQGKAIEREWLAGTLWPNTDPKRAAANLRVILSGLRHALGDQSERLLSPTRHTLALNLTDAKVDTAAFDAAMRSTGPEALKQAVTLYRGPLLKDCDEEWVYQERALREQACLEALQMLGDAVRMAGDNDGAIGYYQRAVSLNPLRETARRGWMEALAKSGDFNAALRVYREYVELLRNDPSLIPDEATSALYTRLRVEARQRSHVQAATIAKGGVVQEATAPAVSGYLPHPLTDMVGRVNERSEVSTKLRHSRLITLTGPGGIGKTRLALEVAKEIVDDGVTCTDGVWFVVLEALSEGNLVAAQIASVLGLREELDRCHA